MRLRAVKGETAISILAFTTIIASFFFWTIGFPTLMIVFVAPLFGLFGLLFLTMPIGFFLWLLIGLALWCLETALIIKGLKRIGIIKKRKNSSPNLNSSSN